MAKSDIHAVSSSKKFGGDPSDYIEVHEMIDSSKSFLADNRHRTIFHHTAGIYYMQKMFGIDFSAIDQLKKKYNLPEEFTNDMIDLFKRNRAQGVHIINSEGKKIHIRDIAEQHILEDFRNKFIPSLNDYLSNMKLQMWMDNAMGTPQSKLNQYEADSLNKKITKGTLNID
jgi:hypothetical protein